MVALRTHPPTQKSKATPPPSLAEAPSKKRRRSTTPAAVSGSPIVKLGGAAKPLPLQIRSPIERSFKADMSHVRVHDNAQAHEASRAVGARAFTYGSNIYLNSGETATNLPLMAHEVTHTLQQQQAPVIQMFPTGTALNSHEAEAHHAAQAVVRGQAYTIQNRTGGATIQRQDDEGVLGWVRGTAGRVGSAIGAVVEGGLEWAREQAWGLVRRYAPNLEPILRGGATGVFNWIRERVATGFQNLFNHFAAPLRAIQNFLGPLQTQFSNALVGMREAAAQIANNDCSSIVRAAQTIQNVFQTITGPYIERLREFGEAARDFFNDIWEKLSNSATEIWDTLSEYAGSAWQEIQNFFSWIWEQTAPMRNMILGPLGDAWSWLKEQLGIADEVEEQGGIWNWIQEKVGQAWEGLKARVEPFKTKIYTALGVMGAILILISPAGPFVILAGLVLGILVGIRWIQQNFGQPDNLVAQRGVLEGQIIPTIMNLVNSISARVLEGANGLADRLREILTEMGGLARTIGGTFLSFALAFIEWLVARFRALANWATGILRQVANWVETGLNRLREYLQPLRTFLRRVGEILLDFFRVAEVVGGRIWNAIPACIRDPFVNFLVTQILARLPVFRELVAVPNIWQIIREGVMTVIQRVFINGDLMYALRAVFNLVLRALNVPVELITQIFQRADQALDLIARDPLQFIRNMLQALGQGIAMFLGNIHVHLLNGALSWLFGQVGSLGITRPPDFSLRSIFNLVMQILGLSMEFFWQRLGRRIGQERVRRIRAFLSRATAVAAGALAWLRVLVTEGPAGLWRHIQERLNDLRERVINGIVGWITGTIVREASVRLLTMLDPTGIMAIVQSIITIYRGLQSFIDKMRQILEVVNAFLGSLLNIANGSLQGAATAIAGAMGRAIEPMIAFMANQTSIGRRIGARVRETVLRIRQPIVRAVDWLIDRVVRLGTAIFDRLMGTSGQTPQQRLNNAMNDAVRAVNRFAGRRVGRAVLRPILAAIRIRYRLRGLEAIDRNGRWAIRGANSDPIERPSDALVDPNDASAQQSGAPGGNCAVSMSTLESMAKGLADRPNADTGDYVFRNKGAGNFCVVLNDENNTTVRVTHAFYSGMDGVRNFRTRFATAIQEHGISVNNTDIPRGGRNGYNLHNEMALRNFASLFFAERRIARIEVQVYSMYEICEDCEGVTSGPPKLTYHPPGTANAPRSQVFRRPGPPPGGIPPSHENYPPAVRLFSETQDANDWFKTFSLAEEEEPVPV